MPKRRLPDLPDTGRQYVENTMRARLASPWVEKSRRARRGGARLVLAVLAVAALVAAMAWLAR